MSYKRSTQIILVIGVAGMLFSGYLSYYELFAPGGCAEAVISCGTKNVTIADLPACVYGFAMYTLLTLLAAYTLWKNRGR